MRVLLIHLAFALSLSAFAKSVEDPSIIVQSRFNREWSHVFLNHLRSVMVQQGLGDPYERTIDGELVFDLGARVLDFSSEGQEWFRLLQQFLKLDLVRSDFRLVVNDFGYKVGKIDAAVRPQSRRELMQWTFAHNVDDLALGAKRMALEVSLQASGPQPIVFSLELLGARLSLDGLTVPLTAVWSSQIDKDDVRVNLEQVDLREALRTLHKNTDRVKLDVDDILIPSLQVRVGSRTMSIDPVKLKTWILTNKEGLKKFLLDVMVLRNLDAFEDVASEDLPLAFPRSIFAPGDNISAAVTLDNLIGTASQVRARLSAVFCDPREATDLAGCVATAPVNPRAVRSGIDYEASLKKIFQDLESNDANIIVSLGESYINQAITTAIKAGLMTEAFGEGEISIAPGGAMVTLDTEGDVFHGYLHLTNKLSAWERRFTGRSTITFPIRLGLRLKIENKDGVPTLGIEVAEATAREELLLKGVPAIGMPSDIATVPRFRNRVIEKVQASVKKFQGQRLVEVPMPFLRGTFFEKTQFKTDGFGRANALFKVDEKRAFK